MVLGLDHATGKRHANQLVERLLGPGRIREGILVPSCIDFVTFDAFVFSRRDRRPQLLGLFARLEVAPIPTVVRIPRRNMAEEEEVVRLSRQGETKPKNTRGRQVAHRQLFIDQVQRVALRSLDRNVHKAKLGRPVSPRNAASEEGVPALFGGVVSLDVINALATNRTKANVNPPAGGRTVYYGSGYLIPAFDGIRRRFS